MRAGGLKAAKRPRPEGGGGGAKEAALAPPPPGVGGSGEGPSAPPQARPRGQAIGTGTEGLRSDRLMQIAVLTFFTLGAEVR